MALPCYVSTEWEGLGHATLRFRPKNVPSVEKSLKTGDGQDVEDESSSPSGNSPWAWFHVSWPSIPPLFSSPTDEQHPVKTHKIECYQSAVYIREYGERKRKEPKECRETSDHSEDLEELSEPSSEQEDDLRPPGITSEVWNAWLEHWEAWKEVLIPLSWVHKYRNQCTPEYISWHDSYLEDYPEVLALITDELGISELEEEDLKQEDDLKQKDLKQVDVLKQKDNLKQEDSLKHKDDLEQEGDLKQVDILKQKNDLKQEDVKQTQACEGISCDSKDALTESPVKAVNGELGMNKEPNCTSHGSTDVVTNADDTGQGNKDRQLLDSLYNKHVTKRYLVHLRSFLYQWDVECNKGVSAFFKREAGIDFNIQTTGEECNGEMNPGVVSAGLKGESSRSEDTCDAKENNALCSVENTGPRLEQGNEDEAQECLESNEESALKDDAEVSIHELLDQWSSGRDSCKDLTSQEESEKCVLAARGTGSSNNKENQVNNGSVSHSSSQKSKASKRRRKKDEIRPQGTSWALKYVQKNAAISGNEEVSQPPKKPSAPPTSPEVDHRGEQTQGTLDSDTDDLARAAKRGWDELKHQDEVEVDAFDVYHSEEKELEKKHWRTYHRNREREKIGEVLKKPPTRLAKVLSACRATLNTALNRLDKIFLPFTALHFLNVGCPGAAVVEYVSSVTEDEPGERERLLFRFESVTYDQRVRLERAFAQVTKFCLTNARSILVPLCTHHLSNLVITTASEIQVKFPGSMFGVWWLPHPDSRLSVEGKNTKRQQRRFYRWLQEQNPNLDPSCTVKLRGLIMHRVSPDPDVRKSQRLYQKVVKKTNSEESPRDNTSQHLTLQTLQPLSKSGECGGSDVDGEVEWPAVEVTFDKDGNFSVNEKNSTSNVCEDTEEKAWMKMISGCHRLSFWEEDSSLPADLPKDIQKYWAQRYRFFLNYDEGIKLDKESWYSVTPEFLAAHQARRCRCEVVVDAMCGAGGNAIQLAKTCSHVIAIDKDPKKVELARHNAQIYGVAECIEFRVGDFFKLAPYLKADVVYLSPPWGGMEYLEEEVYNVYRLGGTMNCAGLLRAARTITHNLVLYLPRNSDLSQVIALAGVEGAVDIETSYMGSKKKAITAYFGDLADRTF